jgi:diguanylate cyclase (GGDEF)-like protein
MTNLPTTIADDADIAAVRHDFVGKLWRGLLVIAVLSLPMTALRIIYSTWLPLYGYHLVMAVLVAGIALVNKRLPFAWRSGLLLALLWLIGLPGVFHFGLAASGIWWLVLSCLVATTLFSARFAMAVVALTGLVLLVAAAGFVSGALQPAIPAARYAVLPSSWFATIVVTGLFSVLVLQAFGGYARASERLLLRIKQQRDEIERLSLHDPLTGLPLASLAGDRIQMALHAARRSGRRVAVLYVDLDGFKQVNDSYGHDAGDAVLRACARRMRACLREEDTVARLGGDEFLAIIGGLTNPVLAGRVAAKLVHAASGPVDFDGRTLSVGASIGIAIFPDDATDLDGLRRCADRAMYAAKANGRNRYEFANPPQDRRDTAPVATAEE